MYRERMLLVPVSLAALTDQRREDTHKAQLHQRTLVLGSGNRCQRGFYSSDVLGCKGDVDAYPLANRLQSRFLSSRVYSLHIVSIVSMV